LEIVSIVLIFIPFTGDAAEIAVPLLQLARALSLLGVAGNVGIGIFDIVEDPSSAPMEILGLLLSVFDIRNPAGFAKMGAARRGMKADDVAKIGTLFKSNSDKLESVVRSCLR